MRFNILMLVSLCVVCVSCQEPSIEDRIQFCDDDYSMDTGEMVAEKNHNISEVKSSKVLERMYGYDNTKNKKNEAKESNTIKTSDRKNQGSRNFKDFMYEDKETLIDYPYSASVKRKGSHYATGALIDKRWVITVASEFYYVRESMKLFRVVLGSVDCKRGGSSYPLKSIEIHPLYAPGRPEHDLALLRTAWPVVNTLVIKPIPVAVSEDGQVVDAKYLTTYWPRIIVNKTVIPQNARERIKYTSMRSSTQTLIPSSECAKAMKTFKLTLGPGTLCLVPITLYHSKCMPDVGAPMVAKGKLWGVTSGWTPAGCSALPPLHPAPTLFTRVDVASVKLWLDTHLLP